jgi:hypothetical protein
MKVAITACLCLLVGAYAGPRIRPDSGYEAFTRAALAQIEGRHYRECAAGNCKFTYVVSTSVDPRAREVLASVRKIVAPSAVPTSAKTFFSNYIEIDKLQVVGDTALIEGNTDPYGHNSLNCGQGFYYPFKYVNGAWRPLEAHWVEC